MNLFGFTEVYSVLVNSQLPSLSPRLPRPSAFAYLAITSLLSITALLGSSLWYDHRIATPPPISIPFPDATSPATALNLLLPDLVIVPARPRVLGYERDQFGPGWGTQTVDGRTLSTREFLLEIAFDDSTPPRDPYDGRLLTRSAVDIDHVVPLAAAWDHGAWAWTNRQRQAFANDTALNLLVTSSVTNRRKSDATLADWLPPHPHARCGYAARYALVAYAYGLPLSQRDEAAARRACRLSDS